MTATEQKALAFLEQDALESIDMQEPLRRGFARVLYVGKDGVQLDVHGTIMQRAANEQAADRLVRRLQKAPKLFTAHKLWDKAAFEKYFCGADTFGGLSCNPCRFAVYTSKKPLLVSPVFSIRQLTLHYAPAVNQQYHLFNDSPYIEKLVRAGVFYGAFVGEELAGFIGKHAEGALGMLEVYPKFRRQGVGIALEADAVNRSLAKGQVPFGDVILGNDASFALQRSMGFSIPTAEHYWLMTEPKK